MDVLGVQILKNVKQEILQLFVLTEIELAILQSAYLNLNAETVIESGGMYIYKYVQKLNTKIICLCSHNPFVCRSMILRLRYHPFHRVKLRTGNPSSNFFGGKFRWILGETKKLSIAQKY